MKHIRLFLSALAAILLLSVPAFAEGGTAEVRTSDEFRAALADPDVDRLVYYGQLIVENDPGGDNFLDAGLKIIEPADRSSDGDNLLFERGVTMLHVSRHRGNTEDPDSQSVRMIYGRDYNDGYADYGLLMDAAQGWVGWYEYHDPNSRDDEDAGYRLCYMLYCGSWQDAVDTAADLTAGDWFHPCSGPADENQIIFLQFGANCHGEDGNIVIDRDIDVTCYMELLGGQNLTVTGGANLTAGALDLLLLDGEGGFHHWGLSSLHVEDGSKVTIHRWEGEDDREDGPYLGSEENGYRPYLGAQGEIRIDNLETGLEYDENADIWCEYRPFLFFQDSPLEWDGPAGAWDELGGADSVTVEDGYGEGFLYAAWFGRREENGPYGWWFDMEGAETAVVTDMDGEHSFGIVPVWTPTERQTGLPALSPGDYLLFRYHDPERWMEWGWPEGWIPNENGTDAFGTKILGAEGIAIHIRVESVPERDARIEEEEGGFLARPNLPDKVLERTERAFLLPGQGAASEGGLRGGAAFFAERPEPGWGLILVDEDFRPVCGKLEITE